MKKLVLASFATLLLVIGTLLGAVAPGNATADPSITAGQILVKFRDNTAAAGILRAFGLTDGPGVGSTGAHLITVPDGKELQLVEALGRNPVVEYAEPDYAATSSSNDQYFPSQYALQNDGQAFTNTDGSIKIAAGTKDADVDAVEAWAITTGTGIKVAVLDSGVANDNPDINPKVSARANFTTGETGDDNYGHGTHVSGIIAATANNTIGVAGVCPGCSILDGKVLNDSGVGSSSTLASGIDWAVSQGAKVINMSLGVRASRTLETAVNNAWAKGAVLVAAAGNGGNTSKIYPAGYDNVIAVAATDNNDARASFSTYGASWVDIAAPGFNVYSTFPNHTFVLGTQNNRSFGYDVGNGTSMSAAVVSATAALAWSRNPTATPAAIRAKIESTADKISGTGTLWANGRVNANNAVH